MKRTVEEAGADLSLDKEVPQSVIRKKRMGLAAMKASVEQVREQFVFREHRACSLPLVPVSSFRYQPRHCDEALRERLVELARESYALAIGVCMFIAT